MHAARQISRNSRVPSSEGCFKGGWRKAGYGTPFSSPPKSARPRTITKRSSCRSSARDGEWREKKRKKKEIKRHPIQPHPILPIFRVAQRGFLSFGVSHVEQPTLEKLNSKSLFSCADHSPIPASELQLHSPVLVPAHVTPKGDKGLFALRKINLGVCRSYWLPNEITLKAGKRLRMGRGGWPAILCLGIHVDD